jgi:hypothetical protein
LIAGAILGLALSQAAMASQAAQSDSTPPRSEPSVPAGNDGVAPAKPGGTRPTTPAPEPARPDPQARKEGAKPALPPAPAEKVAPPIKAK